MLDLTLILESNFLLPELLPCRVYKGTTLIDGPAYNLVNLIHPKLVKEELNHFWELCVFGCTSPSLLVVPLET